MSIPKSERVACRVGHFHTAANFWLTPSPTSPELAALEKNLRQLSESLPLVEQPLHPGDKVVVFFKVRHSWERAFALKPSSWGGKTLMHHIWLIDRGVALDITKALVPPPSTFAKPSFAFEFQLDGVLPVEKNTSLGGSIGHWKSDTRCFVKQLMEHLVVEVEITYRHGTVSYGDVYIPRNGEFVSLTKILLNLGEAQYNGPVFKEKYVFGRESVGGRIDQDRSCPDELEVVKPVEKTTNDPTDLSGEDSDDSFHSVTSKVSKTPSPVRSTSSQQVDRVASNRSTLTSSPVKSNCEINSNGRRSFGRGVRVLSRIGNGTQNLTEMGYDDEILEISPSSPVRDHTRGIPTPTETKAQSESLVNSGLTNGEVKTVTWAAEITSGPVQEEKMKTTRSGTVGISSEPMQPHTSHLELSPNASAAAQPANTSVEDMTLYAEKYSRPPETRFFRILVRCSSGEVTPFRSLQEVRVSDFIFSVLKRCGVGSLWPVQCYSIPAILDGKNTAIVSSARSGKTLGFILPLMEQFVVVTQENPPPKGFGPLGIIVCSGSESVMVVSKICKMYANFDCYSGQVKTRILEVYGTNEKARLGTLLEGCELLITTPHSLIRILSGKTYTNLDRLRWIVLNETDQLFEDPFISEVEVFRKKCMHVDGSQKLQWILAGQCFTPQMKRFLRHTPNHTLIIGSHYEAALYAKVIPVVSVVAKDKKLDFLIDKLKPIVGQKRIAIVCRIKEEVMLLKDALTSNGWSPLVACGDHVKDEKVNKKWRESEWPLLVCADSGIEFLDMYDATYLIHYSLPVKSKTTFGTRFTLLMAHYPDHFDPDKPTVELKSEVMFDEDTQKQVPHIVQVLSRLGSEVPATLLNYSEDVMRRVELDKGQLFLCEHLVGRGECKLGESCLSRHVIIPELDAPAPNSHWSGEVVFTPIKALDGATFAAHLISAEDAEGKRHEFDRLYPEILQALADHFKDKNKCCKLGVVSLGGACAVKNDLDEFFRGKIEQIVTRDSMEQPKTVKVRLLDIGGVLFLKVHKLWELPQKLSSYPAQSVPVHVLGLVPCDFDVCWSVESMEILNRAISRPLTEQERWQGTVRMALSNRLVMDRICVMRYLSSCNTTITERVLAEELLQAGASKNSDHLTHLVRLCSEAGIKPPPLPDKRVKLIRPDWAHFQEEMPVVEFSSADSSARIFVKNKKYMDLLKDIERKCEYEGEKCLSSRRKFRVRVGDVCLVKNNEGFWNRAEIMDIKEDLALCHCVDYGDEQWLQLGLIVPITRPLIARLPFQAIECSLGGVVHPESPSEDFLDEIYNFTRDGLETCYLTAEKLDGKPTKTRGALYAINLMNSRGQSFNKLAVEKGVLMANEDNASFLQDIEIVDPEVQKDEDDEDDEEEKHMDEWKSVLTDPGQSEAAGGCGESRIPISPPYEIKINDFLCVDEGVVTFLNGVDHEQKDNVNEVAEERKKHIEIIQDREKKNEVETLLSRTEESFVDEGGQENRESNEIDDELGRLPALTPKTFWRQDDLYIKLKFNILDVRRKLLTGDNTSYSITCFDGEGNRYRAEAKLYGTVYWESVTMEVTPFCVRVVMPKAVKKRPWPRLTLTKETPNIFTDPDGIIDDQDLDMWLPPKVLQGRCKFKPDHSDDDSLFDEGEEEEEEEI